MDAEHTGAVTAIVALAAVFGLAALTVVRGAGPAEVTALVVAGATAAERLVRHRRRARDRRSGPPSRERQWGPPAATKGPRPQIAGPSRRPDREPNGPYADPDRGSRDRRVTECGDVTSSLSMAPAPDRAVPAVVRPVTPADEAAGDGEVVAGRRRPARSAYTARSSGAGGDRGLE